MTVTGFSVVPAKVTDAAQAFTDPQESARRQADQLRSGHDVVTGDRGLDATIQETMDLLAEACSRFGEVFSATATALNQVAETYVSLDAQLAAAYDELMPGNTANKVQPDGTRVPDEPVPMV
jgi:type VII secretion effector (TIGR04197 family)